MICINGFLCIYYIEWYIVGVGKLAHRQNPVRWTILLVKCYWHTATPTNWYIAYSYFHTAVVTWAVATGTKWPRGLKYLLFVPIKKVCWSLIYKYVHWHGKLSVTCLIAKSCPTLFVTLWTVAHHAPQSMGFPSKNTGVDCHFLLQGIFPT